MSMFAYAAAGLLLVCGLILWRYRRLAMKYGAAKQQLKTQAAAYDQLKDQFTIASNRLRELTGDLPDGVRVDAETGRIHRSGI